MVDEIKFATSIATLGSFAFLIWSILRGNINAFTSSLLLWGSWFIILSSIIRIFEAVARNVFGWYEEESRLNRRIELVAYVLFIGGLVGFALGLLLILPYANQVELV